MRVAVSALAATSGLILLGLAFFGRPDVYLHQAQQEWKSLFQSAPADDGSDQGSDALALQIAQLQQQVMQLKDQLAIHPSSADPVAQPSVTQSPAAPTSPAQPPIAQPPIAQPPIAQPPVTPSAIVQPPIDQRPVVQPSVVGPSVVGPSVAQPPVVQAPIVPLTAPPSEHAGTQAPVVVIPERHEVAKAFNPPTARPRLEAPVARTEPDDTQSVLARLRQHTNTAGQPVDNADVVEQPNPEPARQRLAMARNALLNGSIDDARRMLQEVQLRLVFRPVTPDNNEPATAGPSASDVAHALAALGDNDTRRGLQFIARAMVDISRAPLPQREPGPALSATGYAPPYPQY